MFLALRRGAARDARFIDKLMTEIIRGRLVTRFPHAGIVIGEYLYHASARYGLAKVEFNPDNWDLIWVGDARDAEVIALYERRKARAKYDYVELIDFTPARWAIKMLRKIPSVRRRLDDWVYCYQWCYEAMTGFKPTFRVVPETLLLLAIRMIEDYLLSQPKEVPSP